MDSDVLGHYKHNYEIENENSEAVYLIKRNAIDFTNRFATVSYNNASYSGSKNMLGYAVDVIHEIVHVNLEANNIDETHAKNIEYGKYNDKVYVALKEFNSIQNLGYSDNDLRDVSYKGTDINPSSDSYNESLKNYLEERSSISGQSVEIEYKKWENRVFNLINTPNRNE